MNRAASFLVSRIVPHSHSNANGDSACFFLGSPYRREEKDKTIDEAKERLAELKGN